MSAGEDVHCRSCGHAYGAHGLVTGVEARQGARLIGWLCERCRPAPGRVRRFRADLAARDPAPTFVDCRPLAGRLAPPRPEPSWHELVVRELRLAQLRRRVSWAADSGRGHARCGSALWYGDGDQEGIRRELARLVGPQARTADALLRTAAAYAVAERTLRALLPACGDCGCDRPLTPAAAASSSPGR